MSELIQQNKDRKNFRWQLLATASAVTLLGCSIDAATARSDEPQVWIELGGQLTRLDVGQESYSPEVMDDRASIFAPSANYEELPHQTLDETGKVSFRPKGSDWVFTGGVRYGRSARHLDVTQQTNPQPFYATFIFQGHTTSVGYHGPLSRRFAATRMKADESHLVLDFSAGKDVGLGLFGASSQINLGVRFAQFENKSDISLASNPHWQRYYKYNTVPFLGLYHFKAWGGEDFYFRSGRLHAERNFHGIGPSLSWSGSSPFFGDREDGELLFDYGANAAVLFGRQRAKVAHQTSGKHHTRYMGYNKGLTIQTSQTATAHTRSRSVVVPNVGAMAGVTYRIHDFKISAGYRADFFFNAMDGGNDTRRSEKIGNYGPFATISFGLGG